MKSPDPDLTADGGCFPVALNWRAPTLTRSSCHGVVAGNGGVDGERYWHAWVELDGRRS
jgi:hypothetical protein